MAMTCPTCGAENTGEARFCRICGVQLGPDGFHEAPTRNFEQRQASPSNAPSQPEISPFATYGPDGSAILPPRDPRMYVPPSVVQQPGAVMGYQPGTGFAGPIPTNPLHTGPVKKSRVGRVLAIIAGIFALILVCLIGLGILIASNVSPTVTDDGKGGVEVRVPMGGPIVTMNEGTSPDSLRGPIAEWYYDGSKIENVVDGSFGGVSGSVLVMTSEDDVDSIADFYRDKLADVSEKQEVRSEGQVVFKSEGIIVAIEPSDEVEGVNTINVVLGDMGGIPGGPGFRPGKIPPVPPVTETPPVAPAAPAETPDAKEKTDAKADSKTSPKAEPAAPPAKPARP